jgi:hypothetical protein
VLQESAGKKQWFQMKNPEASSKLDPQIPLIHRGREKLWVKFRSGIAQGISPDSWANFSRPVVFQKYSEFSYKTP